MATDNRIFCYRADGSCYAVLSAAQWRTLRKSRKLDEFLAKQRDAGQVVSAKRTGEYGEAGADTATLTRTESFTYGGADHRAGIIPAFRPRAFDGASGNGGIDG